MVLMSLLPLIMQKSSRDQSAMTVPATLTCMEPVIGDHVILEVLIARSVNVNVNLEGDNIILLFPSDNLNFTKMIFRVLIYLLNKF